MIEWLFFSNLLYPEVINITLLFFWLDNSQCWPQGRMTTPFSWVSSDSSLLSGSLGISQWSVLSHCYRCPTGYHTIHSGLVALGILCCNCRLLLFHFFLDMGMFKYLFQGSHNWHPPLNFRLCCWVIMPDTTIFAWNDFFSRASVGLPGNLPSPSAHLCWSDMPSMTGPYLSCLPWRLLIPHVNQWM